MHVLLLSDTNSPHTMRWARSLAAFGIKVTLIGLSLPDQKQYQDLGISLWTLGFSDRSIRHTTADFSKIEYLWAIPEIRRILRAAQPDILHAHYATSYGLLASLAGYRPFVLSVWGTDVFAFPHRSLLHKAVLRYNFHKADRILATSNIMALEIGKYTKKTVDVTPFGVDVLQFRPGEPDRGIFRTNDIVIGTIKRLETVYGIDHLLHAFRLLKDRHPDLPLRLLIVGGGSREQALRELARKLYVDADTVFTGEVAHDEIPRYHNMITIFAALSLEESFGVSVLEASACGRPVVATRVGGLPEVVEHERTGLLVPPGDARSAADALERLVTNTALCHAMGSAGREFVKRNYDWTRNVSSMLDIYHQVLASAAARPASRKEGQGA